MRMTVGFSTSDSFISTLIRWLTRSKVSHAWVGMDVAGTPLILSADSRGVGLIARKLFQKDNQVEYEFAVNFNMSEHLAEVLCYLGQGYDYMGLVGEAWVVLGRTLGKNWSNPLQSKDKWFCSELVSFYLEECGEKLPCKPAQMSPQRLLEMMEQSVLATNILKLHRNGSGHTDDSGPRA